MIVGIHPMRFLLLILLVCTSACSKARSGHEKRERPPNIILILTDDQGYGDVGCHGHPYLKTPNIDRLYAESSRLTDFHVSPTCSPTRAALMTGRLPFKNGVTHTILERERMTLDATTIAEVLRHAGYTTGIFGKWHLGDEEAYQPHNRGFDEAFIHGGGGIGQKFPGSCADAPPNSQNRYFDPVIRHNGSFVQTEGYCTDIFFRQAMGWIEAKKNQPFFAYISTNAPHGPFICPPEFQAPYEPHSKSKETAAFYGMIANIDFNVGLLMSGLKKSGLDENTLVIFMTDNGSARGDFNAGMRGTKGSVHQGGSRVPAFFRWPSRLKVGEDFPQLTRHVDIFPTLTAIAGADVPAGLDGRNLSPLLTGQTSTWSDRLTFFHRGRWGKKGLEGKWGGKGPDSGKNMQFAVRSERFRLVGSTQIFDIDADPGEKTNLIKEYPEQAELMLAAYHAWWDEVRPMMVNEDVPLSPTHPFHILYEEQKVRTGILVWNPTSTLKEL